MEDKIEVDIITLENGKNYAIIDTIVYENNKYIILVNENNNKDIGIRKIKEKDGKEYVVKLDSKDEFDEVMTEFYDKHREDI